MKAHATPSWKHEDQSVNTGSRRTILFEYIDPQAQRICIAGSFNDWKADTCEMIPLGNGRWGKKLALKPGTYAYHLEVDGHWIKDPRAAHSITNSVGEVNSLLVVRATSSDESV